MPTPDDQGDDSQDAPGRLRRLHLTPWWISGVVFLVVYLGVNAIYGASTTRPDPPVVDDPDRVIVNLTPVAVVPIEDRIRLNVLIEPPMDLLRNGALRDEVTVNLLSIPKSLTFEAGARALSTEIDVPATDGTFEMYPLDSYRLAVVSTVTATDSSGTERLVPSDLVVWGKFPGWRVEPTTSLDADLDEWDVPQNVRADILSGRFAVAQVEVSRSGSTMAIVVLLLTAMVVLTGLALVVARTVATRRRRIEATMASWFAALLFAMVPLRTNFPGAPPIGVWLDFLVFLWVLMGLMIALSLFVASWLRYSPPAK
ncbi:MAG: DUF4436 family protein [Actinobacteria bacterium]|nr:DUF4436 family protein [Actinomycetota bacterium]MCB9412763.1 DUF4436 family protein [Actinomycetota bacterium]